MQALFEEMMRRFEALHADYLTALDGLSVAELDWSPGADMNSLCVLVVHVTEAERFWVGAAVDEPFTRDRPAEFSASGLALPLLQSRFEANIAFHRRALAKLSVSGLDEIVDVSRFRHWPPQRFSRGWALLRGLDHSAEHLGHAGMTRQLLDRR